MFCECCAELMSSNILMQYTELYSIISQYKKTFNSLNKASTACGAFITEFILPVALGYTSTLYLKSLLALSIIHLHTHNIDWYNVMYDHEKNNTIHLNFNASKVSLSQCNLILPFRTTNLFHIMLMPILYVELLMNWIKFSCALKCW